MSDRQKECGEGVFLCLNAFLLNEGRDEKFHTGFPTNLSHFLFSSLPQPQGLFLLLSQGTMPDQSENITEYHPVTSAYNYSPFSLSHCHPCSHLSPSGLFRLQCAGSEEERYISCDTWRSQWDVWGILWHGVLRRWLDCDTATPQWVRQLQPHLGWV